MGDYRFIRSKVNWHIAVNTSDAVWLDRFLAQFRRGRRPGAELAVASAIGNLLTTGAQETTSLVLGKRRLPLGKKALLIFHPSLAVVGTAEGTEWAQRNWRARQESNL